MSSQNVSADVLRTLHRIHRQLTDLRGRMDRGPKKVAAAEAHVKHSEEQLKKAQDELKSMRMATDAKQLQLKSGESKIKDLETKLNTANSNREYQALKDQIAAQKMANSVLDDEILEGWEKIEKFEPKVAEAEKGVGAAKAKVSDVDKQVAEEQPRIQQDITRLENELKECEVALPAEVKVHYDRLVRQRGEDALAAVEGNVCGGCYTQIPINTIAKIMLGEPIFCKTCGRVLYMPEGETPS